LRYSYRSMRALYISVVVMAVFVACQAEDDNRIYAIGSKGITPPKVISTVQPAVAEPKKQVPASEQKTGAGDQNSAPNNTDQKSQETAPGVNTGKAESAKAESGKAESAKAESAKAESAKDESAKDESAKDESAKDESAKAEPGKDEPGRSESGKTEPGQDASGNEKSGKPGKKKKPPHTGIAIISGYVGKDGKFHDAKVIRSAGKDLDPKALQRLSDWRFDPCKLKGVPVNCGMTIEVTFNLY
jgi:TonB family protein